jgi:hypothetical protein
MWVLSIIPYEIRPETPYCKHQYKRKEGNKNKTTA